MRGWRLHLLLCGSFLFHDSVLNREGPLTATVLDHARAVASEGALYKRVKAELHSRTYSKPRLNPVTQCVIKTEVFSSYNANMQMLSRYSNV